MPTTNKMTAVLMMLRVKSALSVQLVGGVVSPASFFLSVQRVMVLCPLRCFGLGTDPCAHVRHLPCSDCDAQLHWGWKRARANLAPQTGRGKWQQRRAGRVFRVAHQLSLAHQCRIGQLVKAWDCVGHAVRDGLAGLAWLEGCSGQFCFLRDAQQSAVAFS